MYHDETDSTQLKTTDGSPEPDDYIDMTNADPYGTVEEVLEMNPEILAYLAGKRNQGLMNTMEKMFDIEVSDNIGNQVDKTNLATPQPSSRWSDSLFAETVQRSWQKSLMSLTVKLFDSTICTFIEEFNQ